MSIDTQILIKVLDDAVANGMDKAIKSHGQSLSADEQDQLRTLSPDQIKDVLNNLAQADKALKKMLFVDTNNNNN